MQNVKTTTNAAAAGRSPEYDKKFFQIGRIRNRLELRSKGYPGLRMFFAGTLAFGAFVLAFVILTTFPQIDAIFSRNNPYVFLLALVLGIYFLALRLSSKPTSYTAELHRLLAEHEPVDRDAYIVLQKRFAEDIGLDRYALEDWLDAERSAISKASRTLLPEAKGFLDKKV